MLRKAFLWAHMKLLLAFIGGGALFLLSHAVWADISYKIIGLDKALEANVRSHIGTLSDRDWALRQRLKKRILSQAREALEALGYYDSQILVSFIDKDKSILLQVNKGEPVRWHSVVLNLEGEGKDDQQLLSTLDKFSPKHGSILNHQEYDKLKKKLHQQLLARGYFEFAMLQSKLEINRDLRQAHGIFSVHTGERYQFGKVTFTNSIVNQTLLYNIVNFDTGTPFLDAKVDEFYKGILSTGYFDNVIIQNQLQKAPTKRVDFQILLTDRNPNRISLGLGYGTDTGPRVKVSWDKPILNSAGHSFLTRLSLSPIKESLNLSYKIPYGHPADDFYQLEAGWKAERFERNEYNSTSFGISQQKKLNKGWVRNLFVNIKSERSEQQNALSQTLVLDDIFFATPGFSLFRRKSNHPLNPDRGYNLSFDFEFSDPAFSSDTRYGRVHGATKGLYSWGNHALLGRLELGYLSSDDFFEVPLSARFFAGGDQSIRGYDYNSLSPVSKDGTLIGGDMLSVASTEYLWRFKPKWKFALFADHGVVGLDTEVLNFTGIGIGIRWLSVVGNIQLDVASRIDSDDPGLRLHFFMGPVL